MNTNTATSNPQQGPRLDAQLCFALYAANLAMSKVYRTLLKPLKLTYPQYLVLMVLWQDDHRSVSEIGERLQLDSATLTPLLKRMDAAGLVVRARSREDERHVVISLTAKGRKLEAKAGPVQDGIFCASHCSMEEMTALRNQLHRLRHHLAESA
ncbi:MarR family winged helix-turn-helix transcriptional regulator [Oleiagrimonas soli]|uniref:MarR family transcriptional regulator n=1 Tax=Oleiagrimonas soli TaxID=1543381 RepID=A0A099CXZ5_9GAMM|nr:MarR family transcriptional regulator [Oleiagrimonas soli]KGI78868.1 MarR family transcriptional regulator [Oleiagrimonas soli]MBB6184330.1 DNA-binding MarR family transcriptional regulator [Oleiagrimonas soli]